MGHDEEERWHGKTGPDADLVNHEASDQTGQDASLLNGRVEAHVLDLWDTHVRQDVVL